jgi:hypothetical protein
MLEEIPYLTVFLKLIANLSNIALVCFTGNWVFKIALEKALKVFCDSGPI